MRSIACLVAGLCALAGCGGGSGDDVPRQTSADAAAHDPRLRHGTPQSRIREMYKVYSRAILDRDFGTACARLAPESVDAMLKKLKRAGITETGCEDAMARIYKVAPKEQVEILDAVARTYRVRRIELHGSSATLEETASARGQRVLTTHGARRIGEEWKLVDTTNGNARLG
jgi:hypothetical protein